MLFLGYVDFLVVCIVVDDVVNGDCFFVLLLLGMDVIFVDEYVLLFELVFV